MVDFNKKIVNSDKFRGPALQFIATGSYCVYPESTSEYFKFWDEESKRCVDGYTADDGDFISGYNYFYLNYCPISRIVNHITTDESGNTKVKRVNEVTFPDFWDYDYYYFNAVQEAQEQGKHLCLLKSRRKGFEQPYSEPVLTPTGFVPMGSLKVGDLVMNPSGDSCKVIEVIEQGEQDVWEVELQDGRKVRCGENHLWSTINSTRGKLHIMTTKEYSKRKLQQGSPGKYFYPYKLPTNNPLHFNQTTPKVDPYVMGVLLGDGYICGSQVMFSTEDDFIVEEMQKLLPNYIIKPTGDPFKYVILTKAKTHELGRTLKQYGVRVKAQNKFIPDDYKYAEVKDRFALLQGLMDTDGSSSSNGACTFVSTSEKLIDDVVWLCRSLGIRCKKSNKIEGRTDVDFGNGYYSNTLPHWCITITTQEPIFRLDRKLVNIRDNRRYNYNAIGIKSIRNLGYKEQQRCIRVDHDTLMYITRDFVVTHNSYKGGSMACRNFYLIPYSKTFIYASNKQYLTDDGILTKAWDYMDFIDKNTAWGKKRSVNTQMRRRAGFYTKDDYGNIIELGYKSEIIGVTLKDNPDVVRGKKANLIMFEEGGSFSELGAAWQIARPSVEVDGIAFGTMIVWGTGGDEGSAFETMKDMFYNPDGYNCLGFDNIWDESATTNKCGFFVPQYTNLDIRDENGKRIYMDEDGNTYRKKSLEHILAERQVVITNATNNAAVDRYVAERPITPAEAMLEFNGNIFPKKELQEQLSLLRTNKKLQNHKQVGDLVWQSDGSLKWVIKKTGDITHYPLRTKRDEVTGALMGDDPTGSIVIWEHPNKDASAGLYIAGIDSYDYDESSTTSLGSCFIYKRVQSIEQYSDIIVAEYTGRPKSAEDFYENVRKLLIYYNARAMYENQNKGIFVYFTNKHCDYLLADQPDIINDIVSNSKVNRKKGCHMNKQIKQWGEGLIKDWLNEQNSAGKKNLYNIMSEPLLEELIAYNDAGNFDRCLTKGTLITTNKGDIPIEEVGINDLILTDKGNYKPVTWTDKHIHDGNIVTLQYSGDYQKLVCTDNHPILVKYTNKLSHKFRELDSLEEEFLRADQLNYKYQFALVPKRNIKNKPRTIDDRMLYVLGWIMGDGYCHPKSNEVKITYQLNQLQCAEQCKKIIEEFDSTVPCKIVKDKFKNCYRLTVYSRKLHKLAIDFGCVPNNKKLNYSVYNNHTDLIPFVLGLFEADGHQNYNVNYDGCNRNSIEISTIYEELMRQCRQILLDNGIYSTIREIKPRNGRRGVSLQISGEYVYKLLNYYSYDEFNTYPPIFSYKFKQIEYKHTKTIALEDSRGFWVPIKLLENKKTKETVYNIEVQDDHTYVANGIVTHNCMALIQVMIYREQLYNVKVKEIKKENRNRVLFEGPIFTQEWFRDDEAIDNIEAYMF